MRLREKRSKFKVYLIFFPFSKNTSMILSVTDDNRTDIFAMKRFERVRKIVQ